MSYTYNVQSLQRFLKTLILQPGVPTLKVGDSFLASNLKDTTKTTKTLVNNTYNFFKLYYFVNQYDPTTKKTVSSNELAKCCTISLSEGFGFQNNYWNILIIVIIILLIIYFMRGQNKLF